MEPISRSLEIVASSLVAATGEHLSHQVLERIPVAVTAANAEGR